MAQFIALAAGVEVNGETVLSVVDGMSVFKSKALKILEDNGIKDPTPGQWYQQQAWLDSFKKISESIGQKTLEQIGMKIPENAQFPPEIDNLEKALASIDVAYHMNHRGGDIGAYQFSKLGPTTIKLFCNNPYPCSFDKGIIQAMVNKFKPAGVAVKIEHNQNDGCRNTGGDSCTYIVKW
jgi:hypothetical protein